MDSKTGDILNMADDKSTGIVNTVIKSGANKLSPMLMAFKILRASLD